MATDLKTATDQELDQERRRRQAEAQAKAEADRIERERAQAQRTIDYETKKTRDLQGRLKAVNQELQKLAKRRPAAEKAAAHGHPPAQVALREDDERAEALGREQRQLQGLLSASDALIRQAQQKLDKIDALASAPSDIADFEAEYGQR